MNLRYIAIAVLSVLILGQLALVWPAYRRVAPNRGRGVRRDISEPVKLAETLKKMQTEAEANLASARRITGTFRNMQTPIDAAKVTNPFEMPVIVTPDSTGTQTGIHRGRAAVDPIEVKIASIDLKGTVAAGRASLALINNEVYRIGDVVNDLTITAIHEYGIEVEGEKDVRRTLYLEGWQTMKERVNR